MANIIILRFQILKGHISIYWIACNLTTIINSRNIKIVIYLNIVPFR